MQQRIAIGMCFLLFWVGGCAVPGSHFVHQQAPELITVHYTIADTLRDALRGKPELFEHPMLTSTFVHLDALDQTSPLGRIIPQQISSRLAQHGLHLVDVRLRTQSLLILKDHGEFALSRELGEINRDINAYSILTGTYTVLYGRVYVTAMILRSSDAAVLTSVDYFLPVDRKALAVDGFTSDVPLSGENLPDPHNGMVTPSVFTRL